VLTQEESERLTRVGPGAPMGALLRRYWHPVATSAEMARHATKGVRLLGEDLVLYRDRAGRLGLIGRYCAHRRLDLVYGMPDAEGLRCPYHGWLYAGTGRCLEQPFEDTVLADNLLRDTVALPGYPVEALGGLVWAYLGPPPAPLVPRWDLLVEDDAWREIGHTVTACNWLQTVENIMDPVHVEWLHGEFRNYAGEQTGQLARRVPHLRHQRIAFDLMDYGIIKRRLLEGETEEHDDWKTGHWLVFPSTQKGTDMLRIRVPVDDTHTAQWYYSVRPANGEPQRPEDIPLYAMPSPTLDARGQPQWELLDRDVDPQDNAIFAGQGPMFDRSREILGSSDRGILLYRRLLESQFQIVQAGGDPMNVFRDPSRNVCLELPTERREAFLAGRVGAAENGASAGGRPTYSSRYPSLLG
jgi:5,5'-dehydrodivanillate O-demethylase oxygenase subunit